VNGCANCGEPLVGGQTVLILGPLVVVHLGCAR